MKRYLLPVFVLCVLLSVSVKAEDIPIKTYIIAGQSNANGYGLGDGELFSGSLVPNQNLASIDRDDLLGGQDGAFIFKGGDNSGLGEWKNLASGFGSWNGNRFGPELSFSKLFQSHTDAKIAIIKYTPNGSSLYTDWNPDETTDNRYDYLLRTIAKAKTAAATRGWVLDISGVIWMQGESDSFGIDAPTAYEQNLANFIGKVRSELNLPNLAFHIGQIADSPEWPNREQIWAAQEAVAARDSNAYLVNGKDLPLFTNDGLGLNNTHYTTEGSVMLGERFASSVASIESLPGYPTPVADDATTEKNKAVIIDALENDNGQGLFITAVNYYSVNGGITKVVNGKLVYTPKPDFTGEDSFWYAFSDYIGRTNSTQVTVQITEPATDAYPQGNPDLISTRKDQLVNIDMLANDTGVGLKLTEVHPWSLRAGTVVIVGNKIDYTPAPGFTGEDKVWYVFEDSQGRLQSSVVTIEVLSEAL